MYLQPNSLYTVAVAESAISAQDSNSLDTHSVFTRNDACMKSSITVCLNDISLTFYSSLS